MAGPKGLNPGHRGKSNRRDRLVAWMTVTYQQRWLASLDSFLARNDNDGRA
jgi:hypothetical protein